MQIWKFIAPGLYKHEKRAISTIPSIDTNIYFFLGGMLGLLSNNATSY